MSRRTRSPHPGVVLAPRTNPDGRTVWRARYRDPDTDRLVFLKIDALACSTEDARTIFAKNLAKKLARRRMDIAAGAARMTSTALETAVADYFKTATARLRPATLRAYRESVGFLTEWAARQGIRDVEQFAPAQLAHFRDSLIARRVTKSTKGAKRGTREERSQPIRPASVNHHLRSVSAFLNAARKHGLTPRLSRDTIAESLACLPLPKPQPVPLKPDALRDIFRAALRHDALMCHETREEHVGARPKGTTPRYRAVAPLVAFTMLTGCRIGEPLALRWQDVDLDAPDDEGNAVGEIRLDATATKTHTARRVTLEVSPRLRTLLATLRLRAGDEPFVFGGEAALVHHDADNARDRLINEFGAPSFTWQRLRQTCGSYLTNAPGIFGAASAYRSAKQLGHSVTIAERHYVGVIRGIPRDARTLDDAMQLASALDAVVAVARGEASPVRTRPAVPTAAKRVAV